MSLSFTWLGHSTFLFRSPGGKRILTDPWISTNPSTPESAKKIGALDLILVTHGHEDHTGDLVSVARATGAHVISTYEVALWLEGKGIQRTAPMGHGGTQEIGGTRRHDGRRRAHQLDRRGRTVDLSGQSGRLRACGSRTG